MGHEVRVAWDSVPQEESDHFIRRMPRSIQEYTILRDASIHY